MLPRSILAWLIILLTVLCSAGHAMAVCNQRSNNDAAVSLPVHQSVIAVRLQVRSSCCAYSQNLLLFLLQLAFVGMTAESYDQIRVWLQYHQTLGVSLFYLFVDGQAARPEVQAQLLLLPGVTVIPRDEELIERQAHSRIWNETWLAAFFHKPCNHELFVRQSLNMESKAI